MPADRRHSFAMNVPAETDVHSWGMSADVFVEIHKIRGFINGGKS